MAMDILAEEQRNGTLKVSLKNLESSLSICDDWVKLTNKEVNVTFFVRRACEENWNLIEAQASIYAETNEETGPVSSKLIPRY